MIVASTMWKSNKSAQRYEIMLCIKNHNSSHFVKMVAQLVFNFKSVSMEVSDTIESGSSSFAWSKKSRKYTEVRQFHFYEAQIILVK